MTGKYLNKYRIKSARNPNWDYGWNGQYFITICTKDKETFFGKISDGNMILSDIGKIAKKCWIAIPEHFPFVKLHAYIIMPDHVHGIIEIAKKGLQNNLDVQTQNFASLPGPQSQNLASIIRGFKIGVTKNARLINPNFKWQARFHDHIIRNGFAFKNISNYIINNPNKWQLKKGIETDYTDLF